MKYTLQITFGQNLHRIRTDRGLSREALGVLLRCTDKYVGRLERGEENVTLRKLEELAGDLNVEPLDLLRE
ncbi:helix-turn-helix domain-containing protein [Aeromicrobium sp. P5_D10]